MRFVTVRSKTNDAALHPAECAMALDPAITRGRIHRLDQLDDGTTVLLYELRGDLDGAKRVLESSSSVLRWEVSGSERGFAYVHSRPTEPATTLLTLLRANDVILDTPVEYTSEGSLRVTLVGAEDSLHRVTAAIADIIEVELERTGTYQPQLEQLSATLTKRQERILSLAVERGYYDVPRRTTQRELATELDVSESTISEHFQKIEAAILPSFAL
ncbi:helix-turn-helix domain-containing protein [Haladaptatus sp. DYF46]|uniref:helix-turn-helix domain-containing protein n=1 Tax=Haladaptatus sp. DYF46 TaxID=2886041 RepID=UPI001E5AA24B|nr:helix-turn-helix domain-containing protein [Haladaptatus sp. DYF46]